MIAIIQDVVERDLCVGCGTCVAVCPNDALMLAQNNDKGSFFPLQDFTKCARCGICSKVCPSLKSQSNDSINYGSVGRNYIECYAGYAVDEKLRYNATSGGLITALAAFAVEIGEVTGVLCAKMDPNNPLKALPFIATSRADVISASGSKYCPVPTNLSLKELMVTNRGHYLIIGLPCHIHGASKASAQIKKLGDKLTLRFGLVCNHTPTFNATKYLLRRLCVPESDVLRIIYRSKGWPGGMTLILKNGAEKFVPSSYVGYWGLAFTRFFWPSGCILCEDKLCDFSDITFMDAWLPEFTSDKLGTSFIIVRTKKGNELIAKAIERNIIKVVPISIEKVVESQSIKMQLRRIAARKTVLNSISSHNHMTNNLATKPGCLDYVNALHFLVINKLCNRNSWFSKLIVDFHIFVFISLKRSKTLKQHVRR